ncbi:hypothetical protein [Ruegeria arenilitoris]|uniref:hypothetical protein n=1 Tax=Ruegeria arenilitoris TaxID=1173585 RepID=UPI00147E7BB8|nr:hypothetical protein [Ruegeria arenilitoris]
MSDVQTLLNLPVDTIAVLTCGYLGYRLAYTGKDAKHKATDTVFLSLAFGLVAKLVFVFMEGNGCPLWAIVVTALACSLLVSAAWRKWVQKRVFKLLRDTKVSSHDNFQSAWESVIADDGMELSQIIVRRTDGVAVMCNDLHAFKKTRTGAFYLGHDGSVALYVTHQRDKGGDWEDVSDELDSEDGGKLMTIIPADQVASTQLRNS